MAENTRELMKQIHGITFRMLCDIDDYCKENGLTYYLSGGSCLGAVRHKGFIPWDHDADIMMPRKDYEIFLRTFAQSSGGKYKVGSILVDKEEKWIRQYSKIWDANTILKDSRTNEEARGIAVDIFPIDGLPENELRRKIYYKWSHVLYYIHRQMMRVRYEDHEKMVWAKKLLRKFFGTKGARKLSVIIDRNAKKYDFDTSKYVGVSVACHYWDKETLERKYMDHAVYLPFEGRKLPVINGYKKYLTNLYGDYMKVPKGLAEHQENLVESWDLQLYVNDEKK